VRPGITTEIDCRLPTSRAGAGYEIAIARAGSFISMLPARPIEVGLVAKLAGHASAAVTLGHYT
jgi:hypothetical protein